MALCLLALCLPSQVINEGRGKSGVQGVITSCGTLPSGTLPSVSGSKSGVQGVITPCGTLPSGTLPSVSCPKVGETATKT